jgi:hypothetical protein
LLEQVRNEYLLGPKGKSDNKLRDQMVENDGNARIGRGLLTLQSELKEGGKRADKHDSAMDSARRDSDKIDQTSDEQKPSPLKMEVKSRLPASIRPQA